MSELRVGFLILGTTDMVNHIVLCCGSSPAHCRVFSSIPGVYPLEASSSAPLQVVTIRKRLQTLSDIS